LGDAERTMTLNSGPVLESSEVLLADVPRPLSDLRDLNSVVVDLHEAERSYIENVLIGSRWVIGGENGAAEKLGIPPSTLRSKMENSA
jgi:transcriptional regulator with GAF, ATPase, and Fis domain